MNEKVSGSRPNYKDDLLSLDISQRSTDITLDSNFNLFEPLNLFSSPQKGPVSAKRYLCPWCWITQTI